ncbi:hypothetical protein HZB00_03400 [Candidatus Woesearchaeota archaeon]|nr:hypothetical protein [Candidatus Woesearchaeota archaeon]
MDRVVKEYKELYKNALNECVDRRYRQIGFEIFYALFAGHTVSPVIQLCPQDQIIFADIDFKTHTTPNEKGEYLYPKPELILSQLGKIKKLWVAGFHVYDCVEKVAKAAYE